MKIIYVNCGWNMSEIWSSQCAINLRVEKATWKKFRLERDSNPWPCDTGAMLYSLSYQATWIDGQLWVRDIPADSEIYEYEYMKIICANCGWNMSEIIHHHHIYDSHLYIYGIYKRYANHRKDLLPTFLVSKKTKWNDKKPHTQIETPPKFRPAVHPRPSFARFCETRISSNKF